MKFLSQIIKILVFFFPYRVVSFCSKAFKKISFTLWQHNKSKKFKSKILIDNKSFILNLKPDDHQAHDVYATLHNKNKIVYELPLVSILLNILRDSQFTNFLDLGSFMGYYPCLVSKLIDKNKLRIISIESNLNYFKYIKKNILDNRLINVEAFHEILSDGVEDYYADKEKVYKDNHNNRLIKKKSITLDVLCDKNEINAEVVKIDVHGFEGKVFNGFKKTLKEKVKIILLELHSEQYLKQFSSSSKIKIFSLLSSLDFNCYIVPFNHSLKLYHTGENFKLSEYKNVYCKITQENFKELFFDKMNEDNLIIAIKKDIDINKFSSLHQISSL